MSGINLLGVTPITGNGSNLQPGINKMCIAEWKITNNTYGKQLEVHFKDGERVKKCWVAFYKAFEDDATGRNKGYFVGKLTNYKNIIASYIGESAAQARFTEVLTALSTVVFDNTSKESVHDFEEKFVQQMFEVLPTNFREVPIPVILHFNGNYLNIPTVKENSWQIQFGENLIIGKDLNMSSTPNIPSVISEATIEGDTDTTDYTVTEGADLPF